MSTVCGPLRQHQVFQHLHYRGPRRRRERENWVENVFDDIMAEKFPKLKKETDFQVQEAQGVPKKMNSKRPTPRFIITKAKVKERILKAAREKQGVTYKRTPVSLSADFSAEIL